MRWYPSMLTCNSEGTSMITCNMTAAGSRGVRAMKWYPSMRRHLGGFPLPFFTWSRTYNVSDSLSFMGSLGSSRCSMQGSWCSLYITTRLFTRLYTSTLAPHTYIEALRMWSLCQEASVQDLGCRCALQRNLEACCIVACKETQLTSQTTKWWCCHS